MDEKLLTWTGAGEAACPNWIDPRNWTDPAGNHAIPRVTDELKLGGSAPEAEPSDKMLESTYPDDADTSIPE